METDVVVLAVFLNALVIGGGILIILMAMYQRGKKREMWHRERLAMIERGLAPPPERDPAAFDDEEPRRRYPPAIGVGIVIAAIGFGLMLIIGITANAAEAAVGVGGAIIVLGVAFIVLGALQRRSQPPPPERYPPTPPQPPAG